jgi:hypothetical protein
MPAITWAAQSTENTVTMSREELKDYEKQVQWCEGARLECVKGGTNAAECQKKYDRCMSEFEAFAGI